MEIKQYWLDISKITEKDIVQQLDAFPKDRQDRILSCKNLEDKKRSLGAGILISRIHQELVSDHYEYQIIRDIHGKPYFMEDKGISFNISHSGKYVYAAASNKPIGVDVEEIGSYKDKLIKRFFSERERTYLDECQEEAEKIEMFYRLWVIKESYIKYLGIGMGTELNSFWPDFKSRKIEGRDKKAYFEMTDAPKGYASAICYGNKIG